MLVAYVSVLFSLGSLIDKPIQQNDVCSDAVAITTESSTIGTTNAATIDSVGTGGFCGTSITAPGVWYKIVGDGGIFVIASTSDPDTDYDTKLSVFTGDCNGLTCVTGDNNGGDAFRTSKVAFTTNLGENYFILVHGSGSAIGNFVLILSTLPIPAVSTRIESSLSEGAGVGCIR